MKPQETAGERLLPNTPYKNQVRKGALKGWNERVLHQEIGNSYKTRQSEISYIRMYQVIRANPDATFSPCMMYGVSTDM